MLPNRTDIEKAFTEIFAKTGAVTLQSIIDEVAPESGELGQDEIIESVERLRRIELQLDSLHIGGACSDNAAPYTKALIESGFPTSSCICHTLSLSLHDVIDLQQIGGVLKRARGIVARFRSEHLLAMP